MSAMTPISEVQYEMTDGGTITLTKAPKGWNLAFNFGSDASLDFIENVASIPVAMAIVDTYCDRFNGKG